MEKFSELIKNRREKLGLSLRDLENLLQERGHPLSKTHIIFLEKERKKPTYEVANFLAEALDIDVKKALKAAYRARADFDRQREKQYIDRLVSASGLKGIDPDEIVK